jgi:hypothetical protein
MAQEASYAAKEYFGFETFNETSLYIAQFFRDVE